MAVNDPINPFDSEIDVSSSDTLLQDLSGRIREKQNYDQKIKKFKQNYFSILISKACILVFKSLLRTFITVFWALNRDKEFKYKDLIFK